MRAASFIIAHSDASRAHVIMSVLAKDLASKFEARSFASTLRMTGGPRRAIAAFTLLELLLATAIIAVVGVTLFASMSIAFRARSSAQAQVEAMREASIAMDIVQQDLQSVVRPSGILAGPFVGYAAGSGDAKTDSLEFHTLGRDLSSDGIRRVRFELRNDVQPSVLVRYVETNLLAPTQRDPVEEPIARNVRSLAIRYFDGYGWSEQWDSWARDNALPVAVEVTITLDAPSPIDATRPYRLTQVIPLSCAQPSSGSSTPLSRAAPLSLLPVFRERDRVGVLLNPATVDSWRRTLTPTLSRSTGRGGNAAS